MKTYSLTFTAGESKQLPSGVHLELITSTDSVDITYRKNQTDLNEKATNVSAGYFFTMPRISRPVYDEEHKIVTGFRDEFDTFDLVEIYSATAQTVVIGITQGDGGSRSTATNLTGGTIDLISAITPQSIANTAYVRSSATSAINTVVTPAANTNGVLITSVGFNSVSEHIRVMTKSATPSTWDDGVMIAYMDVSASSSNYGSIGVGEFTMPIIIPAGLGVYEAASSGSNSTRTMIAYEVL